MKLIRATVVLAMLPLVAMGVAGCVSTTDTPTSNNTPTDNSQSTETPKATATPTKEAAAPIDGDLNGDGRLDPWEKEQLAKKSYVLPNGTAVPLPAAGQPLPAPVVQAVQSNVHAKAGSPPANADPVATLNYVKAAESALNAESAKVGLTIIPVYYGFDGGQKRFMYGVGGDASGSFAPSGTAAEALAHANQWIGSNTDKYVAVLIK